jgi:hypothetical protein
MEYPFVAPLKPGMDEMLIGSSACSVRGQFGSARMNSFDFFHKLN